MNYRKMIKIYDEKSSNELLNAPKCVEETNLNDDEINEVMSYLLHLSDTVFDGVPLNKNMCKQFVWNIPDRVYNLFRDANIYGLPHILNPINYLYIFCARDPVKAIQYIIQNIANAYLDDEFISRYIPAFDDFVDTYIDDEEN